VRCVAINALTAIAPRARGGVRTLRLEPHNIRALFWTPRRNIGDTLGCGSRQSAMSFPLGEAGAAAKEEFLEAMKEACVDLVPEAPGQGLASFSHNDPRVHAAENADCLEECLPFIEAVLGSERCRQLGRSFYA